MFGRKSRRERLEARAGGYAPVATLITAYEGARPVVKRLLYDDDLRDNIRVFIESARNIVDELSGEDLDDAISKLWDDRKLRKQIESAAAAAQEGSKRVRGQRIGGGGRSGRLLFLLLLAAVGGLFLHPKTGPEARRLAREAIGAVSSE